MAEITKAAAISSAMLTRKQSFKARESFGIVADLLADETQEITDTKWFYSKIPQHLLMLASLLSLISVSSNTPYTIENEKLGILRYIIYGVDATVTLLFTAEAALKMKHKGIMKQSKGYMRDKWCQFDFFMLVCHWLSVAVQTVELTEIIVHGRLVRPPDRIRWLGLLRSPRPLIMVRLIRSVLKIQLPKNRISQVFKRSSQQVYNVTIFFLFFMSLYGILGVQFFGRMDYHCMRNTTDPKNVTIADFAIPDMFCAPNSKDSCPDGMNCMRLNLSASDEGYYGMFNNFMYSVFSVYMAASQEGWVYVMYDCIDSLPSWKAFVYFTTLIFFLAWLVKNVFIAVITETFAEIRVQFSQMWGNRELLTEEEIRQIIERGEDGWRLVALDANTFEGWAPKSFQKFQRSMGFQITMMVLILANAVITASLVHKHDDSDNERRMWYYYIECGFTLVFNIECLFKIWCLGLKSYARRGLHKFELILCIGSSLNIIKPLYDRNVFTYCQVFRIVRLIKASPMLEDFVYKIFGPGKKLGSLVLFTMALLLLTSSISLQLFCFVQNLEKFRTLPEALMSMFQIMTQEGWTDVVVDTMRACGDALAPLVAIYFVAYHLFVTLIVLSLFVAVILDNLEMEEDLKKVKQLKAREQNTSSRTRLPLRLRVFSKFPDRPQMVVVKRVGSEFPLPKIRDTFTNTFSVPEEEQQEEPDDEHEKGKPPIKSLLGKQHQIRLKHRTRMRKIGAFTNKGEIGTVLERSNKTRVLLSDSAGMLPIISRLGLSKIYRDGRKYAKKSTAKRGLNSSVKAKQMYDHLKENGDLNRPMDTAEKKDLKQGEIDFKAIQQKKQQAEITRNRLEEEMKENHPFFDRPLFALPRGNKFRKLCQLIVYSKYIPTKTDLITGKPIQRKYKAFHDLLAMMTYLEWTMFFITCISCMSMMYEQPWPVDGRNLVMQNSLLQIAEYVFVVSMTLELTLKVLANGLFFTPKAVIRDFGGVLTVFIYVTSLTFLVWMPKHVRLNSGAMLLMIFRCMRPLRIYTLVPHIRRVVVELCKGFKEILLVTVLLIVLMFMFASYGVQIAGGKLAKCNDITVKDREKCVGEFELNVHVTKLVVSGKDTEIHPHFLVPRAWVNPRNCNFDHIGNAMLALFEILSFKMWTVVRDVIQERLGIWAAIFVHVYVFIGCLIGLTLFVGVVIANYSENRGTALLTVDQRRWNDLKNRLKMAQPLHIPPKPSESAKARLFLYNLTMSPYFETFFSLCVLLNCCLLWIPWSVEEEEMEDTTNLLKALIGLGAVFTLLFSAEVAFKMIAYSLKGFWQSKRNRIDLIITLLGLAWCALHFFIALPTKDQNVKDASYMFGYSVVVLRFFTIAARHSTLKMLMLTVLMSVFRSFFIIMAMFLLMLFYAYAGVILFGMTKYGQAIGRHANFRTPVNALTVLFRIVTGEDWNEVMHDCMRSVPYCWHYDGADFWQTDCGNYYGAIIYFCSFYLIITYIVLNLLVAIIMENFSLFYSSEEDALLSYADIRNFQNVWNIVDVEQKGDIPVRRVKFLLRLLKGRLEVDPDKDRLLFKHMCFEMERLHNGEEVSFHDVLIMLSYRSVDIRKHLQLEELIQREELEYIIEEEVAKQTIRSWLESCLRLMRQKEQNTSIINSLRATNDAVLPHVDVFAETQRLEDREDSRTRKKAVSTKTLSGPRRGSVGGAVVEAAKKFLSKAIEKPEAKVIYAAPRRAMKGPKNLPEVTESNEEPSTGVGASGESSPSLLVSPDAFHLETSPVAGPTAVGATSFPASQMTHMPEIRQWWSDQCYS